MKIGVRAHDLAKGVSEEELAKTISDYGFSYLQLVFPKALKDYSYDDEYVKSLAHRLKEKNLSVAMLGAYFNPVHSDPAVVNKGISNFKANLRIAHLLGHPPVGSETGSYNDSPWTYVPKNHTEEAYVATKKVFRELVSYAEEVGEDISIEPAWGHVIYSPEVLERLVKELNSKHVYVTIDLFNLLNADNFVDRDEIFLDALTRFNDRIRILHLKDAVVENEELKQVAPGKGGFHYPKMIEAAKRYCPKAILVFEGVGPSDIGKSHKMVSALAK